MPTVVKELIEEEVECRSEIIPTNAMLDKNVDVCLVCRHLSSDPWLLTDSVVKQKLKNTTSTCLMCFHDLHTRGYLCDSCLLWFHFRCVGLTRPPKSRNWFCRSRFTSNLPWLKCWYVKVIELHHDTGTGTVIELHHGTDTVMQYVLPFSISTSMLDFTFMVPVLWMQQSLHRSHALNTVVTADFHVDL